MYSPAVGLVCHGYEDDDSNLTAGEMLENIQVQGICTVFHLQTEKRN
jgi:hypothetical protein